MPGVEGSRYDFMVSAEASAASQQTSVGGDLR